MTLAFNQAELFGGAITAQIPVNFTDVRATPPALPSSSCGTRIVFDTMIRQVPDNQEVYLDKNGFTSLTFDITERVSHLSTDKEALEYHFTDIVAETDTQHVWSIVENVELPNLPSTTPILALTATTRHAASTVAATTHTPAHINIHFTLIRLAERSTDIVITLNIPHLASEANGQASNGVKAGTIQQEIEQEARNMYHQIVTSFAIKDWSLFSGE